MVSPPKIDSSVLEKIHLDALPKITSRAVLRCASLPFFKKGSWYLAGGTALALQAGHRQSVDLDFFTTQKTFNEKQAAEYFSRQGNWETTFLNQGTLYGKFYQAKISFISYPFFKVAEPFLSIGTIKILTPPDIAAMKIIAISQRGRKRDFVDIYWLTKYIQNIEKSIKSAERQYNVPQNLNHLLKSLSYFADAENDPMPTIFFKASWSSIKKYLRREVAQTAKKLLKL